MKKMISIGLLFLLVLSLSGCLKLYRAADTDDPTNTIDDFCDRYPEALLCNDEEATEDEIVNDIITTAFTELKNTDTKDFCDFFFSSDNGELMNKCLNEALNLIPEDIDDLSNEFVVTQIEGTNDYQITVDYDDGSKGYVFYMSVILDDGVYKITSFSFESRESLYVPTASEIRGRYLEYFIDLQNPYISKEDLISEYFIDGYSKYLLNTFITRTRSMIEDIYLNNLEYISYFNGTHTITIDYSFVYREGGNSVDKIETLAIHVVDGEIKVFPIMEGSRAMVYYASYDEINVLITDMFFEFYDDSLDCETRFTEYALDTTTICSSGTTESFFPSGVLNSYKLKEVGKGGFLLTFSYYDEETSTTVIVTKYIMTTMGRYGLSVDDINDYSYYIDHVIGNHVYAFMENLTDSDITNNDFCAMYDIDNCTPYRNNIINNGYSVISSYIEVLTATSSYTEVTIKDSGGGERVFEIWLEDVDASVMDFYIE